MKRKIRERYQKEREAWDVKKEKWRDIRYTDDVEIEPATRTRHIGGEGRRMKEEKGVRRGAKRKEDNKEMMDPKGEDMT